MRNLRHHLVGLARLIMLGALTLTPLLVTLWLANVLLNITVRFGSALLGPFGRQLDGPLSTIIPLAAALAVLALAGALGGSAVGRRISEAANRVIDQTPVAKTVYRGVEKILASFQAGDEDQRRVVLIAFPSPEMKAIGFVTRRFIAADSGRELAAVYVPTTPNPSSGYIEVVPVDRLVWLDWTAQEAIQFIMSGGVIGPDSIAFERGPLDEVMTAPSRPELDPPQQVADDRTRA